MSGPCTSPGGRALVAVALLLAATAGLVSKREPPADVPAVVARFMASEKLPGAVVAFGPAGEPPTVRAFGSADVAGDVPMRSHLRFRIASLSKPITAAAVLALVAEGRLALDEHLVDVVPEVRAAADPRHGAITVRHLLQHTAGWDRRSSFDPMLAPPDAAAAVSPPDAAPCAPIAFAMLRRPLDFEPGTRQVYANLGYCWLEIVVERRSGVAYEAYVRRRVLEPLGLAPMRIGENGIPSPALVRHHARGLWRRDPLPRGGEAEATLARLGAAGGWVATAAEYFRFAARPIAPETALPPDVEPKGDGRYGLSWRVWSDGDEPALSHAGFMAGVFTTVARLPGDIVVVAFFNGGVADGLDAFERLFAVLRRVVEAERRAGAPSAGRADGVLRRAEGTVGTAEPDAEESQPGRGRAQPLPQPEGVTRRQPQATGGETECQESRNGAEAEDRHHHRSRPRRRGDDGVEERGVDHPAGEPAPDDAVEHRAGPRRREATDGRLDPRPERHRPSAEAVGERQPAGDGEADGDEKSGGEVT
jgi:N-acyl-D-amino-acid deacylase